MSRHPLASGSPRLPLVLRRRAVRLTGVALSGVLVGGLGLAGLPGQAFAADGGTTDETTTVTLEGERLPSRLGRKPTSKLRTVNTTTTTATPSPSPSPTEAAPEASPTAAPPAGSTRTTTDSALLVDTLGYDRARLLALPTSGSAWTTLKAVADGDLGTPDLGDQDNKNAGRTFGAALVYARTAEPAYRAKVIQQLQVLPTLPLTEARVLSVARQLAGYVAAADLVDYRDPAFVDFVARMRTHNIGNHGRWYSISQTSADTASNWGAWALSSRIAASLYVGDAADVAVSAKIFRGFLGDRLAYAGFRPTADFDSTWVCGDPAAWVPINPAGCGAKDGAIVEDISRSAGAYPSADDVGRTYSWEVLGGATLTAELLSRAGYSDVYSWSDRALLRAAQFLSRNGGYAPLYSTNQYIPWNIRKAYGVELGTVNPAGLGRQYGFSDWLY